MAKRVPVLERFFILVPVPLRSRTRPERVLAVPRKILRNDGQNDTVWHHDTVGRNDTVRQNNAVGQ